MAVEASHLHQFPLQQLIPIRGVVNPVEGNMNLYNTQMGYSLPLSGTATETLLPAYNSLIGGSFPSKAAGETESGLTSNIHVQRKRMRDSITPYGSYHFTSLQPQKNCSSLSFLGDDISRHVQQQQLDADRIIAQHMEKMRLEIEEKRKAQARRVFNAIEFTVMKKLKAKEEEIEKIGKLNWLLEERIRSLFIENQTWKELAHTNEATANALRTNLAQVLSQSRIDDRTLCEAVNDEIRITTALLADDAESCCGSNEHVENLEEKDVEMNMSAGYAHDKTEYDGTSKSKICRFLSNNNGSRLCRNCEKEESCVLILPCRHLCLCTVCGSTLHTCPICKSIKDASVHVNLTS